MPVIELKKHPRHFITTNGNVFRIESGKEVPITAFKTKRTKDVVVVIEKKVYKLLYLMIEYFVPDYRPTHKLKFTITEDLRIPANSIIIKPFVNEYNLTDHEQFLFISFKCESRASSANSRCVEVISPLQVFLSLKIHNYTCVYCGRVLEPGEWHLDHFTSLHRGGKNIFENIVPSCNVCNIMKGAMEGKQFYAQCKQIAKNYMFIDSMSGEPSTRPQ